MNATAGTTLVESCSDSGGWLSGSSHLVHQKLQVKRFLAHPEIVIKHGGRNRQDRSYKSRRQKVTDLTQHQPHPHRSGILRRQTGGNGEREDKQKRCCVQKKEIQQVDHKGA